VLRAIALGSLHVGAWAKARPMASADLAPARHARPFRHQCSTAPGGGTAPV